MKTERSLIVGVYAHPSQYAGLMASLDELTRLAETAGLVVVKRMTCELRSLYPATFIGKGKIEEIHQLIGEESIDVVFFNDNITPTQNRNLEERWGIKVIDRTGLILDIFAQRAHTQEGKLQVELAQLKYLLPRLVGQGISLSRLGGGVGTRGPGETKLEIDRRRARDKVNQLQKELKRVRTHRELQREKRSTIPLPLVSMVGYTNAGKSTLMNYLTQAGVLVEDKLFATLDPTIRRLKLPSGREVLLADTVGFVDKLPHQLIEAFKATFEELEASVLLLHLVDASHPLATTQSEVVTDVLRELGLGAKRCLRVLNKSDLGIKRIQERRADFSVSALTGQGIDGLLQEIERQLSVGFRSLRLLLPYPMGAALPLLYRTSRILRREDRARGVYLELEVDDKNYNKFKQYRLTKRRRKP